MAQKVVSLIASIGAILLGIYLSYNSNRLFYGLVLAGTIYGIYDIYLIATHKRKTQEQQKARQRHAEQKTFGDAPPSDVAKDVNDSSAIGGNDEYATIIVSWFKEKMGLGQMVVTVNGVTAGAVKKDNLHVTYQTKVPFNIITMGIYKTEIELSPGDTVEYFIAGNGIYHDRTVITRKAK